MVAGPKITINKKSCPKNNEEVYKDSLCYKIFHYMEKGIVLYIPHNN